MDNYGRDEYHVGEIERAWKSENVPHRYETCFEQEVLDCMKETGFTFKKSRQMVVDAYIEDALRRASYKRR